MKPLVIVNQTVILIKFQSRSIDLIFWIPFCTFSQCLNYRRENMCNFVMFIFSQMLVEKKIKHLWGRSREWGSWGKEHMLPIQFSPSSDFWFPFGICKSEFKLEIEMIFSATSLSYCHKRERKAKAFQNAWLSSKIRSGK